MTRLPHLRLAVLAATVLVAGCSAEAPSSAIASASIAASASASASARAAACPEKGPFAAGTYRLSATQTLTIPATITIADRWDGCGLLLKEWGEVGGLSLIGFWNVENVYANPCHWDGGQMDPAVGPTAADLVTAMVDQELTEATAPSADTLGGRPASYVRLSVQQGLDVSDCDAVKIGYPEFRFWKGPGEERTGSSVWWIGAADAPGLIGEVWASDVDGARVVVQAAYVSDATQAQVDEIHGIIRSIAFDQ